jgi:rubredoxin
MPQISSYDDVKIGRKRREIPGGLKGWRTEFIKPPEGVVDHPVAFLAEDSPQHVITPHFHQVDQFQVIVSGGGTIGKHELSANTVHFARAYTPYGPIVGDHRGVGFLTLRAQWDPGAQMLPFSKEKLKGIPDRRPWQATEAPKFDGSSDAHIHTFSAIRDERGLAAYSLELKASAATQGPDPSNGNGQFIVITKGSIVYREGEFRAISIAFIRPDEGAFPIVAGAEGAQALVLNFPRPGTANPVVPQSSGSQRLRVFQCMLCSFVYDESKGMPHDGIPPGTRWEDVPDTWTCPDCAASRADFAMVEVA